MAELDGKRIFIVEDNVTNMAVFAITLKQHGAIVIQDSWNTNAINKLLSHLPIDVILLDLMLRQSISGYDLFRELQAHPELHDIPVVAVSAADPSIEMPKARALGFRGFISKPIRPGVFASQIAAAIGGTHVWDARQASLEDLI